MLVLLQVPRGWNGFAYVCAGSGRICGTQGSSEHALVFGPGDHVTATTNEESGLRFLLVAGQPIGEPVAQYGRFVMNTQVSTFTVSNFPEITQTPGGVCPWRLTMSQA